MKTMPLYESPYRSNKPVKANNVCLCCGKEIKNLNTARVVHMNVAWLVVHPSINDDDCLKETGDESQGCFLVGADCAKHMVGFTSSNIIY